MALDAASNGNFNTISFEEAYVLIENFASSNNTKNADFERQRSVGNVDGKQIAELKTKLDSVHNILVNKKSVQFVAEVEAFEPEGVNYIGENGFQGQRFSNHQGRVGYNGNDQRSNFSRSYGSSSYQTPPTPSEQSKMESMLEQLLEDQQKIAVDFNGKIDSMYTDLNGKFEALNSHVKKLDAQVAQTAETVKRQEGFLPRKTDTNPRQFCNAVFCQDAREAVNEIERALRGEVSSITLRSGKEV